MEKPSAKIVDEKLDLFFKNLMFAAKVKLSFGFMVKNTGTGGFTCFYAHERNALLDWSKLVCTWDDLAKLKDFLNKSGVIESCSRERMNAKWRFYKLTNLTVFAVWLKDVPMGCKGAVLPEPLLKTCTVNCLTFEENTRQPHKNNLCFFLLLLSLCTEINGCKKKHVKLLTCFWVESKYSALVSSQESFWTF